MVDFFRGPAGRNVAVLVIALLVIAATVYAWKRWGGVAVAAADRQMTLDSLQVTPQPPWIRADVTQEVFRDGSLAEVTYLDRQLTFKVHRAFEMHACVAKVDWTSKRPSGKVLVDLHYRRPVAWVEIPPDGVRILENSGLPIDEAAVVLDPADLNLQADDLPIISISGLPPCGPKGTSWADPRLLGAARLASLLESHWRDFNISQIRGLSPIESRRRQTTVYELVTNANQRIIWGSAPGLESPQEPQAVEKLDWLKRIAARGQLSGSEPWHLDLRVPSAEPSRRMARSPAGH